MNMIAIALALAGALTATACNTHSADTVGRTGVLTRTPALMDEGAPDAPAPDGPVTPDAPADAGFPLTFPDGQSGQLAQVGDSITVSWPRWSSFDVTRFQDLAFEAPAGTVSITVEAWGNYGTAGGNRLGLDPDGLEIGIAGAARCPSQYRLPDTFPGSELGCQSICSNPSVATVAGTNHVPLELYVWNGYDAYSVDTEVATITLVSLDPVPQVDAGVQP